MSTEITKKCTAFRLNEALVNELKVRAQSCNSSLNKYVEGILSQAVYSTPNAETVEAIEESRAGRYAGSLDVSDYESFMGSIEGL